MTNKVYAWMYSYMNILRYINFTIYCIDGLVQDCSNSIANAMELLQSCIKQLICVYTFAQFITETLHRLPHISQQTKDKCYQNLGH